MKIEIWNGHAIRFIEKDGAWWAVAKDVAGALGFRDAEKATQTLGGKYCDTYKVGITSDNPKAPKTQEMIIISEKGLYRLIMRSNKPEAEAFQDWVFDVLKILREASGLEGFQVFRLLDKEHQKAAMQKLQNGLCKPVKVDFIKANTLANKTVSSMYGYPKMIKKADMNAAMLKDREPVLDDVVNLMTLNEKFNLGLHISKAVYTKYDKIPEAICQN